MRFGQVNHVDIVANTGTIGRVVVVTENLQFVSNAHRCLCNKGDKIIGHAVRKFADESRRVCTDGIEVAKNNALDGCAAVDVVANNLLVNLFGVAVGAASLLNWGISVTGRFSF